MHKYTEGRKAQNSKFSVSVVGARGYSGLETARLLLQHPKARLTHCFATTAGFDLAQLLGRADARGVACMADDALMENLTDVVFLATPAEVSMKLAPSIIAAGKSVIDLSGAFRLKTNDYLKWYGFPHEEKSLLAQASYGLNPWAGPAKGETLVANPGCYATAISMVLIPLLKNQLVHESGIVIDAKSGTTGAGKKAAENMLFSEVDGECLPYKVGRHQHYPEIQEAIAQFAGRNLDAHLTTSLLPTRRGIIAGIYANLRDGVSVLDIQKAMDMAYSHYPLVNYGAIREKPWLVSLKRVVGTAKTHIGYEVLGSKLYMFSCLDNLLKGAASQAIENFNRLHDLPVQTGLDHLEAVI